MPKGCAYCRASPTKQHAVSVYDNPLSSRFDENDALMYFDDVKVPWERLFVHRDPDMCRAQFHDTQGHAYQNYQAQIRLSVKIAFLAGLARRVTEAIGTTKIPSVSEQLGTLAAQVGMVNAMLSGMEASRVPARRMVRAEQAFHVFGAGADPGPLPAAWCGRSAISPAAR